MGPKKPVSLEVGLEVLANCIWVLETNSDLLKEHSELLCLLPSSNLVVLIHQICGISYMPSLTNYQRSTFPPMVGQWTQYRVDKSLTILERWACGQAACLAPNGWLYSEHSRLFPSLDRKHNLGCFFPMVGQCSQYWAIFPPMVRPWAR